jgi:hypothetical protein
MVKSKKYFHADCIFFYWCIFEVKTPVLGSNKYRMHFSLSHTNSTLS